MIDSSICQIALANRWAFVSRFLFDVLTNPQIVVPVLSGFTVIPWVFAPRRWKRPLSGTGALMLVVYILFMLPPVTQLGGRGLAALIPADNGQPADAIVVLGRGREFRPSRVRVAAELWKAQRAPIIFASGRGDAMEIGQRLERKQQVPAAAIQGEPCSGTTDENAEFTAALLQPQGVKRLILVTDPPHMLRSVLTFRSFGFEVIPHPSPIPNTLTKKRQQYLVLREWAGLVGYGILGRYFSRHVDGANLNLQVGLQQSPDSPSFPTH